MFRINRFQQLLKFLPRSSFEGMISRHKADKYSKGFGCWDQLVCMLYAQLSGASSLRVLEAGFNSQSRHHYHLGVGRIKRSTLADANTKRDTAVFEEAARHLMAGVARCVRQQSQQLMYLLDSSPIALQGREFDQWTLHNKTRHTQGLKLHVLLNAQDQVPQWHSITAPNVNDLTEGHRVPIEAGARYVFDKGYCDYGWWHCIDQAQAFFVTRFKRNAKLQVVHTSTIDEADSSWLVSDEQVCLSNKYPRGGRVNPYGKPLRRVVIKRQGHATPLVLATNDMQSPASDIARNYKERWSIELFFKWIKQHLKIKRFLGRSANAVRVQILTALIAYLLLSLLNRAQGHKKSLWMLLAELRESLFDRLESSESAYGRRRQYELKVLKNQALLFA
jgi:IS4 transposase